MRDFIHFAVSQLSVLYDNKSFYRLILHIDAIVRNEGLVIFSLLHIVHKGTFNLVIFFALVLDLKETVIFYRVYLELDVNLILTFFSEEDKVFLSVEFHIRIVMEAFPIYDQSIVGQLITKGSFQNEKGLVLMVLNSLFLNNFHIVEKSYVIVFEKFKLFTHKLLRESEFI